jgi:hypothetical protein
MKLGSFLPIGYSIYRVAPRWDYPEVLASKPVAVIPRLQLRRFTPVKRSARRFAFVQTALTLGFVHPRAPERTLLNRRELY